MIFTNNHDGQREDSVNFWYLNNYHPYWNFDRTRNSDFDDHSNQILELKKRNAYGVNHFYQIIDKMISKNVTICVVPSSDSTKLQSGIRDLAQRLASNQRLDATHCLRRHTTIPKASHGGPRNIQVHKDSICVDHKYLIKGKEILLLDDVATSVSSINACGQLLIEAGARKVVKLVLGYTTR